MHALELALLRQLAQVAADGVLRGTELLSQIPGHDLPVRREPAKDELLALGREHVSLGVLALQACAASELHDTTGLLHTAMTTCVPSSASRPLLMLIAGPYMPGTGGDPQRIAANRAWLESQALPVYRRGHLPLMGEWMALPIIHSAGGKAHGDAVFQQYQYPVAHRLLERCDAVLRISGESKGADMDVARARKLGLLACFDVSELPDRSPHAPARAS